MAYLERRTTKGGKVRWRALVRLKGSPAQSATFRRKTDAKRWIQQTESAIREGRMFPGSAARRHTLADLIDRYERDVLARKPEARTRDTSRHLAWWKQQLGTSLLSDVTPSAISEHRDKLARGRVGGRERSNATVNRYLASLGHALEVARREWEWTTENPVRRVSKLKEPRGRVRFLSEDERPRLLEACRSSRDRRLYPLVLLALATGARRGELLRLKWQDIDLDRGIAVLHETKNDLRRSVPITGPASNALGELGRVRSMRSDLIFASSDGSTVFPRWAWQEALKSAKVEGFRFHDLRHSAASYLAMSGATLAEIAAVLGHRTLSMVKRYSHLTEQHTSDVVARMNEKYLGSA